MLSWGEKGPVKIARPNLPRSGHQRELLRAKGQFWTPGWVAEFMVAYALQDNPKQMLDPALGEGVFFRAAKQFAKSHRFNLSLFGRDVDPEVLLRANHSGLNKDDLQHVELRDFVLDPPAQMFPSIVANPPYIRHHRLAPSQKSELRAFARETIGHNIDGRAGFHVYFLIRALKTLSPGGRLSFIVSADICEGVFAHVLWQWIASRYRLDAVITFSDEASPFPDIDTNAIVFCIQNARPQKTFSWIKCKQKSSDELAAFLLKGHSPKSAAFEIHKRNTAEAISTGLSRPPTDLSKHHYTLGDFASVMRGIVTGDNAFFFMTQSRANELSIPEPLLTHAIGRVRDVEGDQVSPQDLVRLEKQGRPTRLLNVNGFPLHQLPKTVQEYLKQGEQLGIDKKTLIRTRKPWYRMETRKTPPIMFAYLGRRNTRFIRNRAGVVPLTCLLCIYPKFSDDNFVERLWRVLSAPDTVANLKKVGKSYGGGAIKVEPRALERLPLPEHLVIEQRLEDYAQAKQRTLFD